MFICGYFDYFKDGRYFRIFNKQDIQKIMKIHDNNTITYTTLPVYDKIFGFYGYCF